MYRNCRLCNGLMYGPDYEAWQNNCSRCQRELANDSQHASELAQARKQTSSGGPIIDSKSVAEIENEELREELTTLRGELVAAKERADRAESIANARVKQNEAQIRIHFDNTREWKDALETAERERDELLEGIESANSAARIYLEKITQAQAELPAYTARMKKLGAVEALEDIAKDHGIEGGKAYLADVVYREFPDRLTMRVGVVDAAELMNRAAQLRREGAE